MNKSLKNLLFKILVNSHRLTYILGIDRLLFRFIYKYFDGKRRDYSRFFLYKYYNVIIGKYTLGYTINTFWGKAEVGNFCSIGPGVVIGPTKHDITKITTHSFLFDPYDKLNNLNERNIILAPEGNVIIGNDVYIGANSIIMPNINIGDGVVIGAGSIVTKNIEPYAVVYGVPAKVHKYRFSDEHIKRLLEIKWWNWSDEKIKNNYHLFIKAENFLKNYN